MAAGQAHPVVRPGLRSHPVTPATIMCRKVHQEKGLSRNARLQEITRNAIGKSRGDHLRQNGQYLVSTTKPWFQVFMHARVIRSAAVWLATLNVLMKYITLHLFNGQACATLNVLMNAQKHAGPSQPVSTSKSC
jgi:hypothetical protein